MSEESLFWGGTTIGDAGPYSASSMYKLQGQVAKAGNAESGSSYYNIGTFKEAGNSLSASIYSSTNIRVQSGAALVDGCYYKNSANIDVAIPAATSNPRIDYIVVRKNFSTITTYTPSGGGPSVGPQEARITRIVGSESATPSPPTLTQDTSRSTYWDIPICTIQVSTGGVLSNLDDRREFVDAGEFAEKVTSTNNDEIVCIDLNARCTGAPTTGFGPALHFNADSATEDERDAGEIAAVWETATDASRLSQLNFFTYLQGTKVLSGVIVAPSLANVPIGNARGQGAVDLQGYRNAATEVASGECAALIGGAYNTASGDNAGIVAGFGNEANGDRSIAAGYDNQANGNNSCAIAGFNNVADGQNSFAGGYSADADGDGNFVWVGQNPVGAGRHGSAMDYQFYVYTDRQVQFESSGTAGLALLDLYQADEDEPFIRYWGTSAADDSKNLSNSNGDGSVDGPKNRSASDGWTFIGMIRIEINDGSLTIPGGDYWMPFYSRDEVIEE